MRHLLDLVLNFNFNNPLIFLDKNDNLSTNNHAKFMIHSKIFFINLGKLSGRKCHQVLRKTIETNLIKFYACKALALGMFYTAKTHGHKNSV